jgi:hypothetical protein
MSFSSVQGPIAQIISPSFTKHHFMPCALYLETFQFKSTEGHFFSFSSEAIIAVRHRSTLLLSLKQQEHNRLTNVPLFCHNVSSLE